MLESLTLHSCALPIHALSGVKPQRSLDLSSRGLLALDGVVIGALIARNSSLTELDLQVHPPLHLTLPFPLH